MPNQRMIVASQSECMIVASRLNAVDGRRYLYFIQSQIM